MRRLMLVLGLLLAPFVARAGVAVRAYVRSTQVNGSGVSGSYDMTSTRGAAATTLLQGNACSGTSCDTVLKSYYSTGTVTANTTVNGTVTCNIRGLESSTSANNGLICEVGYRRGTTDTAICSSAVSTEWTASQAAKSLTCTASSVATQTGDRLYFKWHTVNVGTGSSSYTITAGLDGPTAAAAGDSYVNLPVCLPGVTDDCVLNGSATIAAATRPVTAAAISSSGTTGGVGIARTDGPFANYQNGGTGTSLAITGVNCTAGTTLLLSLAYTAGSSITLDAPSVAGGGLSWSVPVARDTGQAYNQTMFFWADCPSGISAQTITITHQSNDGGTWAWATIEAFSGTNTASPIGASNSSNNTNSQPATVTVDFTGTGRTGSYLAFIGANYASNATTLGAVDANSTALTNDTSGATYAWTQRRTALVNAGSYTMTRALSGTDRWCASAVEIKAASPADGSATPAAASTTASATTVSSVGGAGGDGTAAPAGASGGVTAGVVTSSSGGVNMTIATGTTHQAIDGMGASVHTWNWRGTGESIPAIDALLANGVSIWRVSHDKMDWVARESDITPLHNLDASTLARIYETSEMQDIWATIAYLNSRGIAGNKIVLNFMGWTPTWLGGSGALGVASYVTAAKNGEAATMIASLVYYGRVVKGLSFTQLSPFNEPNVNGLEGPLIAATQYRDIAALLVSELSAMGVSDMRLVVPEEINDDGMEPAILGNSSVSAVVDHLAYHSYTSSSVSPGTTYAGKNWWLSETAKWDSNLDTANTPPSIGEWPFAKATTDLILGDVINGFGSVLVWEGWDAWWYHHGFIDGWGLLGMTCSAGSGATSSSCSYTMRQRGYANGQITKALRPGMLRVDASTTQGGIVGLTAGYGDGHLGIVGRNSNAGTVTFSGQITGVGSGVTTLRLYETNSGTKSMTRGSDVTVTGGLFSVAVSGDTIFSLVAPYDDANAATAGATAGATAVAVTSSGTSGGSDGAATIAGASTAAGLYAATSGGAGSATIAGATRPAGLVAVTSSGSATGTTAPATRPVSLYSATASGSGVATVAGGSSAAAPVSVSSSGAGNGTATVTWASSTASLFAATSSGGGSATVAPATGPAGLVATTSSGGGGATIAGASASSTLAASTSSGSGNGTIAGDTAAATLFASTSSGSGGASPVVASAAVTAHTVTSSANGSGSASILAASAQALAAAISSSGSSVISGSATVVAAVAGAGLSALSSLGSGGSSPAFPSASATAHTVTASGGAGGTATIAAALAAGEAAVLSSAGDGLASAALAASHAAAGVVQGVLEFIYVPPSKVFAVARSLPTMALQRFGEALGLIRVVPSATAGAGPFRLAAERGYVGPVRIAVQDAPQSQGATALLTVRGATTWSQSVGLTPPATFSFSFAAGDLDAPGTYYLDLAVTDGPITNTAHGTLSVEGKTP